MVLFPPSIGYVPSNRIQISKLDPWKTSMCLRIKRAIEAGAGQGEDGDEDEEDIDLT